MTLLLVSFLAGALTVTAPCILPLLPVIVGGTAGGKSALRALVVVLSLGASVVLFTLLLKATTTLIAVPALFWQVLSGGLLLAFGAAAFFPSAWDSLPMVGALYRSSNRALGAGYQRKDLVGDVVMGAALGPVFSSCSPTYFVILAAVLPANFGAGVGYLLAYAAGLCLFLFAIALAGQRAAAYLGFATRPAFKKAVGALFVVVGLAVIFGIDKRIEAALPAGAFGEVAIEEHLLGSGMDATSTPTMDSSFLTPEQKASLYPKAPELVSPDGYINTNGQPINLAQYRGKDVVLIDFWDYSCINCQRTLPYVNAWYQKYKDQGLVIIGVHTPEFAFEQLEINVADAVRRFGIEYPVVLDNHYQTWGAYQNQFWPREYLVDIDGYIVHDHAGEGDYDGTEAAIQRALAERAARLGTQMPATTTVGIAPADLSGIGSPETYFGSTRNEYLANGNRGVEGPQTLSLPSMGDQLPNALYLGGAWDFKSEFAQAGAGATIRYAYSARDVYLVAAPGSASATIRVLRDGKPVGSFAGADVDPATGEAVLDGDRLYKLVHDATPGAHLIEIDVVSGTLDAYTLTFG